ncbi:hypothetical protein QOT17_022902 [Balamuthia mandrillaris]
MRTVDLVVSGWSKRTAKVAEDIAIAAKMAGLLKSTAILPTRTKSWSVLRGPFKDKKAQTPFLLVTHKRLVRIEGEDEVTRRFVSFAANTMEPICSLKVTEHHYIKREELYSLPEQAPTTAPTTTAPEAKIPTSLLQPKPPARWADKGFEFWGKDIKNHGRPSLE